MWYILIVGYIVIYFTFNYFRKKYIEERNLQQDKPASQPDKKPSQGGGDKKPSGGGGKPAQGGGDKKGGPPAKK